MIAWSQFDVHYHGKEAHASAFPELGINALDALTIAQTAIGLLRQHIRPTDRVHGIITQGRRRRQRRARAHLGALHGARRDHSASLDEIQAKVMRCFEAGALATGATLDVRPAGPPYAEVTHDAEIAAHLSQERRSARALLSRPRRRRAPGCPARPTWATSPGDAVDPPDDRSRLLSRREPPARVHGALRHASRGPGAARRRRWRWRGRRSIS